MGKAGLSVFVLSLSVTVVTACGNTIPDPYGSYAGAPITGYGVAGQTVAGSGIANGGTKAAAGGSMTIGTGGSRTTATGGGKLATGGKTTTGAGGKTVTGTGGKTGAGGTGTGGKTATGGAGGKTGTGGSGATSDFFPKAYNSACVGDARVGANHYPNQDCLACHRGWPFAGTVFQSNGSTGAQNVEIGIKSGSNFLSTCTSRSGGIFLVRSGTVSWSNAEVRIRNSKGEKSSMHKDGDLSGSCNAGGTCHGSTKLIEP
jgi:hypothetical protein